jgi:predicted dehydrogenase
MPVTIFGYGDVVRNKYLPNLISSQISNTTIVDLAPNPKADLNYLNWSDAAVDIHLQSANCVIYVIATPPQSHIKVIKRIVSNAPDNRSTSIYVEKPFAVNSTEARKAIASFYKNNINIRVIDHYREKSVVGWLFNFLRKDSSQFETPRSISFESFEQKTFSDSEVFDIGYALEHGVHALPMIEAILGRIDAIPVQALVESSTTTLFNNGSVNFVNKFDFKYCVGNAKPFVLNIAGGKKAFQTRKILSIMFENSSIICDFENCIVKLNWGNCEEQTFIISDTDAYGPVMHNIYNNKTDARSFISMEDATRSIELIEKALSFNN